MRIKRFRIIALIITLIMVLTPLTMTGCSLFGPSENDIQIITKGLDYDEYYRLCLYVKIKNTSSKTIKVSFYGKILLNGEIIDESYSNVRTLNSGDSTTLIGPIIANPRYSKSSYSYEITKWNFY